MLNRNFRRLLRKKSMGLNLLGEKPLAPMTSCSAHAVKLMTRVKRTKLFIP